VDRGPHYLKSKRVFHKMIYAADIIQAIPLWESMEDLRNSIVS